MTFESVECVFYLSYSLPLSKKPPHIILDLGRVLRGRYEFQARVADAGVESFR